MFTICENNSADIIFELEKKVFKDEAYKLNQIEDILTMLDMYKIISVKDEKEMVRGYVIIFNNSESLEIMKIGVDPEYRKHGFGTILLNEMKKSRMNIFLEVRETNETAIKFYENNYFKKVGKRKNYYKDTNEAAILMAFNFE